METDKWEVAKAAARQGKENCSTLTEEFNAANTRVLQIDREFAIAKHAMNDHNARCIAVEYPTGEETAEFEKERAQLQATITDVASRRREAVAIRERARMAVLRASAEFSRLARAEQNLHPEQQRRIALAQSATGHHRGI